MPRLPVDGEGPEVTMLLATDRVDEPWRNGGGSTREIAALPGPYGPMWRLSMARVAADGPFSVFPGITRTIMVMAGGEMMLNVAGVEVRIDSEPFTFDGGSVTYGVLCGSAVTDFNVMTERGQYDASTRRLAVLTRIVVDVGETSVVELELSSSSTRSHGGLSCPTLMPG